MRSGSIATSSSGGSASASGRCRMIPSSDHSACVSMPCCSRSSARSASPQGACTRAPNGESTHSRQSPISSRKRSTTIVRSEGRTPVASSCSRRYSTSVRAARSSQACRPRQPRHGALVVERGELALEAADRAAELERPARLLALPERHLRGLAGRGGDEHAVARDLLDAPRRRAEQEHLALAGLVHHLLVELADATAAVDQEHAVEAAVGDRAGVRDGDALRPLARAQGARRPLPHDARAQLRELVRRVAPGEQVEHVLELLPRAARGRGRRAVTSACSSSICSSSTDAMATICWHSTSSGMRGTRVCSTSPSSMPRATAAASTSSPRKRG